MQKAYWLRDLPELPEQQNSNALDVSAWEFVNKSADKIRIAEAEAAYIRHFKQRQARQLRRARINAVVSAAVLAAMFVLCFAAENLI